jgi:hypothetical protein
MERRDVLKLLVATAALPALSPEALSLFRQVHSQVGEGSELKTLNPHQDATVVAIAELIIPQTDTPGAKALKVNEFIDLILTNWYDEADTSCFLSGLADLDKRCQRLHGKTFLDCTESQQNQLLSVLDRESIIAVSKEKVRSTSIAGSPDPQNFFYMMKKLTLVGYYTSRVGFVEELHHSIIPPAHAGCAPLPAEGKQ